MTTLKRAIEFCFSPVGILTFLFVAGLVMGARRRTSAIGRRLVLGGVFLYLVFLLTPLADILVATLERPFPPMMHPTSALGARSVVVLAGYGVDGVLLPATSQVYPDTMARMTEGIRLYRELAGAKLVVSGGVLRTGERPVADLMADFAVALGVPRGDIVTERSSRTTYENLREVKKIVGSEPFILVNSAPDLWRAAAVARKLGMKPLPAAAGVWAARHYPAGMSWKAWGWRALEDLNPSVARFNHLQHAYHEYGGYLWYWMLGRV